jgi:chemotaxis protein methyltransferase CheR
MTLSVTSDELQMVYRFVHDRIGFFYAPDRMNDLKRGFLKACQDLGIEDIHSCVQTLGDPSVSVMLEEVLIKNLTIGETYFFRDRNLFAHLRDNLLPDLIRSRRLTSKYIRIWCAACSTGEEPYSIAILLCSLLPDIVDWEISILATDINPGSLYAAERGIYSRWSFREESPVPIERYVQPSPEGRFQVSAEIKRMVRFDKLNLITDRYPSSLTHTTGMDLILCRNVLMYFSSELAEGVVDRLNSSLIDGGWFIVSPQEINCGQRPGLIQLKRGSVFLFQRNSEKKKTADPSRLLVQTRSDDSWIRVSENLDPEHTDLISPRTRIDPDIPV